MTTECLNCGAAVSDEFARVMGDNENRIHYCQECGSNNVAEAAAGITEGKFTGAESRYDFKRGNR